MERVSQVLLIRSEKNKLFFSFQGFTAKTVCSGYFVSRRPVIDLFEYELAGLSAALFGIEVDNHHQSVLSFVGPWPEISKFLMLPSSRAYFISETLGNRRVDSVVETDAHACDC